METRQLEHHEIKNKELKFPIVVVCDNITSPENVGMIFRIAEAMGIAMIYLCGDTPSPEHKRVKKTSRSTEKYLDYISIEETSELMDELKAKSFQTIALELTNNSTALDHTDFSVFDKIALIVGNEQHGVAQEVLDNVDASVEITMFGKNTSINVVNSLSIALYEITKQFNS